MDFITCTSPPPFTETADEAFLLLLELVGQIRKRRFCVLKLILTQINKDSLGLTRPVSTEALTARAELTQAWAVNASSLPKPLLLSLCLDFPISLLSLHLGL